MCRILAIISPLSDPYFLVGSLIKKARYETRDESSSESVLLVYVEARRQIATKQVAFFIRLLAAVKNFVAQIFESQRRIVRASGRLYGDPGIFDLTDENRMIALLDGLHQLAFDERRSVL